MLQGHGSLKNIADPDYIVDLNSIIEMLENLIISWLQNINEWFEVFNFRTCADDPDDKLPDLQVGSRPVWASEDPVHRVPELYRMAAVTIIGAIAEDSLEGGGQPAPKKPAA
jgi:hypothetical protein